MMAEKQLKVVVGAKTSDFEKAMKKVEKSMMKVSKTLTSVGEGMTKTITAPILAVTGTAIKAFADFEKAMTSSTAIMGDMSEEMRTEMEKTARDVAKTTRFSAVEAAESYFYLASAGLDAAQSIKALPTVAAFAQAGNFDLALATSLLADAQSALGLKTNDTIQNMKNMIRVSDVLVKANILANANVQEFSEALTNKAAAALRLVNKDMEEGVAVLAVFADQGLKGAAAGEALNITLRDLQRAALKNDKIFKQFNVDVYDSHGNMNNLADIIGDLEKAFEGMSDKQLRSSLMMLGFQEESVSKIAALLGMSDAIRGYEADLRSAGGVTQEVADKQLSNLWDQLGLVKSRITDAAIELGDKLAPTIQDTILPLVDRLVDALDRAVNWFSNLTPETRQSYIQFALLAAAIGPVLMVMGGIIGSIVQMMPLFKLLGKAFLLITAPAGLAVLKVAAITAAVLWLMVNLDKVLEVGKIVFQGLGDIIRASLNIAITMINAFISLLNKIPGVNIPLIGTLEMGDYNRVKQERARARDAAVSNPATRFQGASIASLATGTNYIPKDGLYHLHQGEAVVPKEYNTDGRPITVIVELDGREIGRVAEANVMRTLRVATRTG